MFPIDIYTAIYLIFVGFMVGILSGFFGFGGGFIITPFVFSLGAPMNVAVGTSIAQILGTSVIATMRHRNLGHVDMKLGIMIAFGSILGIECGAQIVEYLKNINTEVLDISLSLTYIFVLGFISIFMIRESWKSRGNDKPFSQRRFASKVQRIKIPPMISFPTSNVRLISLWIVFFIGFFTGVLAGFMGAGGGFILLPSLVYIIGCQTVVAVGTGLLGILSAGIYGCFSHSIKGNVDILLAVIMLIISSIGAQIGASATKYVKGANLRLIFGFCVGWVSISVAFELIARLFGIFTFRFLSQALLILIVVSLAFLIMVLPFKATSPSKFKVEKHSGQR